MTEVTMQQQIAALQQQLQTLQEQQAGTDGTADRSAADTGAHNIKPVRDVKIFEGVYTTSPSDYRTYRRVDCQMLTQYSDRQVVMQMHLNMDIDLKRSVETNYNTQWDAFAMKMHLKCSSLFVCLMMHIRSGVFHETLQQELLQNHETLTTVSSIIAHCEAFESAVRDKGKLSRVAKPENMLSVNSSSIATIRHYR